ncbi:MAG: hypothetical protein ACOC8B_00515 [Gemmatimonadota bacterium]
MTEPTKPRVTVTKTGVHRTTPSEILRSEVGREIIRKTSEAVASRRKSAAAVREESSGSKGSP